MAFPGRFFQPPEVSHFLFGPLLHCVGVFCPSFGTRIRAFLEDYPEAQARLLYRGEERLEVHGDRCEACEACLAGIRPSRSLG